MKTIKNSVLALAALLLMTGCNDALNYNEVTENTEDEVFQDFKRVNNYMTNLYSYLENGYDEVGSNVMLASASDEAMYTWSNAAVHSLYNGTWSSKRVVINYWSNSYWGIRACNYWLEHFPLHDFAEYKYNLDFEDQIQRYNRYQYEARFIRAYLYFILVRAYGDVPLVTKVLTESEANEQVRAPKSEIFDFIVKECDAIQDSLPVEYASLPYAETGRITKLTVMALKARTLMYRASKLFQESGDNVKELWYKAAAANKELLDSCQANGIKLGNYADLFIENNFKNVAVIYGRRTGNTNSFEKANFPVNMLGANGGGGNCPTQTMVDAYRMKSTGKLWYEEGSCYDPANPYAGRDPRMALTIVTNGTAKWPKWNTQAIETFVGGRNGLPNSGGTPTGYYLRKYCNPACDFRAGNSLTQMHSWIIYRIGEFYLNYAECVANYFGNADATDAEFTISATEMLNALRTARQMPKIASGMSMDDFMETYRNERMVELAFEGHRFWDLRRWEMGENLKSVDVMELTMTDGVINYERKKIERSWDDKMYFFPIPDSEIRKNAKLKQNPGWED